MVHQECGELVGTEKVQDYWIVTMAHAIKWKIKLLRQETRGRDPKHNREFNGQRQPKTNRFATDKSDGGERL